jgi:hypothetical protein
MTVSTTTNRVSYNGTGALTPLAVDFPFQSAGDLVVVETIIATGVQTTKTITTDYAITGTTDNLGHYSNGGTVTPVLAFPVTVRWTIYRDPARTQGLDLVENDSLPAESVEATLDYLTMLVQRLADMLLYSLRQPDGDSTNIGPLPTDIERAAMFLAFDAQGDPVAAEAFTSDPGSTPVTVFAATLLDDNTQADARTTLGVPGNLSTTFILKDNTDPTKRLLVNLSGITTGTDRTLTVPNANETLVGRATTDTLTNKTLTAPAIAQVVFPATQVPSAGANTLDDYEEGTWTPSVGGTATYIWQVGRYIKIGRLVTVACTLSINFIGSGSLTTISGLPFAAVNVTALNYNAPVLFANLSQSVSALVAHLIYNTSSIVLQSILVEGATMAANNVITTGTTIEFTMSYFTVD